MAFGSDRTVKVGLTLDPRQYIAGVQSAARATKDFGQDAEKHALENKQAWTEVGTGMLAVGAVIATGVGLAVKAYADFDKEMSGVRAVSGATAFEMEALGEAALQAGADTAFSASEAAAATRELAKVGISTADILGGALTGSLNLAAAGNLDLARAAEISGQTMKIFGLAGEDVSRIADALANGANKSAADVEDLSQALAQGGLVAAQTGLNLEETVGTLALFADNAMRGSDAGTSLRTLLLRLTPTSKEAAQEMERLGLNFFDTNGEMLSMTEVAGQLQGVFGELSTEQRNAALATIFGQDAIRGANILIEAGAEGLSEYIDAMGQQGEAARVAAIQMDNLAGDIETLGGSFETVLIQSGGAANDALRDMIQTVTGLLNAYGSLPQPVQEGVLAVAALTAGILLLGGAALTLIPRIAATKAALIELTGSATAARAAVAGIASALAVVAGAFAAVELGKWSARASVAAQDTDDLAASLRNLDAAAAGGGSFGDLFESDAWGARDQIKSTADALDAFAESAQVALGDNLTDQIERLGDFGSSTARFGEQVGQIDAALAALVDNGNADEAAAGYDRLMAAIEAANEAGANIPVDEVAAKFTEYQAALDASREAADGFNATQDPLWQGLEAGGQAAEDAREAIDKLVQSLASAGLVQLSTRDAARAWEQALDDLTASIDENGKTLDITTQAGRDNEAALDSVAKAAINQAQAMYESTGSEEAFRQSLIQSRAGLVASARQFGMSQSAAEAFADEVLNIPAVKAVSFSTPGLDSAINKAQILRTSIMQIGDKTVTVRTNYVTSGRGPANQNMAPTARASGGPVWPGETFLVGERGPELVTFPRNGYVHDTQATQAAFSAASSLGVSAGSGSASLAGLEIEGTLDLGNGLEARMRGVVRSELSGVARSVASGSR